MSVEPAHSPASPFIRYVQDSRSALYSAVFALPLFLLYEAMAVLFRQDINNLRNGADVLIKQLLRLAGVNGLINVSLVILAGLLLVIWRNRNNIGGPIRLRYFGLMLGESVLYASVLGFAVSWVIRAILLAPEGGENIETQIIISLGAGIYEELVFRVLLVSGLHLILHRVTGFSPASAWVFSAVIAALVFSGFHYVGALGDVWTLPSFLFRFVAGLVLSGLFIVRGYGITAYTHALYDLFVTFQIV
ncbi:MAG: CPBP family intramembrane metalloprotease [Candidatus Latescibacteria bacterium]|nr:CPBP family intramembrane metalloprotease [Candidatus Latescibacterota bacterium]